MTDYGSRLLKPFYERPENSKEWFRDKLEYIPCLTQKHKKARTPITINFNKRFR